MAKCTFLYEGFIDGAFDGWHGDTIVRTCDRRCWQQADYKYQYYYCYRSQVVVYEDGDGTWLKIQDREPVSVRAVSCPER